MFKLLLASSSSSWLPVACPTSDSGSTPGLLDRVVEQAKARGLGRGRWVIMDGTKVAANVAIRNQLELIREGSQRLVQALQQVQLDRAAKVHTLAEPLPDADYPDREALLAAESACGEALLNKLKDVAETEVRRLAAQYRAVLKWEGVASFTDPEARWGFQKKEEAFLGYKVTGSKPNTQPDPPRPAPAPPTGPSVAVYCRTDAAVSGSAASCCTGRIVTLCEGPGCA